MSNLRNSQLLQQMSAHPLKATLAKALDLAETFQGDMQFLQLNKDLSEQGRDNARRGKLRAAVRDLRDIRAPINELQAKLDKKRAAVAMPPFDPKDVVGFLRRQELRAALRAAANIGQRTLLLEDPAFADAMLEQPPALSGLHPQHGEGEARNQGNQDFLLVEAAKKRRLETLFAPQLEEIAALEQTIAEANMIADIARVDLKLHSGMEDRQFADFTKPIEGRQAAPWLVKVGDAVMRVRPEKKDTAEFHTPATADEVRDGVYFESEAAYRASRAA